MVAMIAFVPCRRQVGVLRNLDDEDPRVSQNSQFQGVARTSGTQKGDYFALLKVRVMPLVVFTGLVGLVVAPGGLHPVRAALTVLSIAVGGPRRRRLAWGTTATSMP